jgi:superfamily I DNA and/or RNA helicase
MIIFNCVRSNKERDDLIKRLGFLLDERRVNVAITRPRDFLFIIGNRATLSVEKGVWKKVNEGWV